MSYREAYTAYPHEQMSSLPFCSSFKFLLLLSYYVSLRSEFLVVLHIICVCLRIVVSNTYCVVFLFCFSSCCQFLWIVHF